MSNAISLAKELQQMKAIDVIRNERVRSQFISVYNSIWKEGGENVYEREAIYFNQQLRDKDELRLCSGTSIFYAFIDLAVKGITLAPGAQALCYLLTRNCKVGVDSNGRLPGRPPRTRCAGARPASICRKAPRSLPPAGSKFWYNAWKFNRFLN